MGKGEEVCRNWVTAHSLVFDSALVCLVKAMVFLVGLIFISGGQNIGASAPRSISPSSEYSGLTPSRIDWFDLLAVQGTSQESSGGMKGLNKAGIGVLHYCCIRITGKAY